LDSTDGNVAEGEESAFDGTSLTLECVLGSDEIKRSADQDDDALGETSTGSNLDSSSDGEEQSSGDLNPKLEVRQSKRRKCEFTELVAII
jgi:hypothetical protein